MGWFLWGLFCTLLLTNSIKATLWIWGTVIGGSVIFGFYRGYKQRKEEKRLQTEYEANKKFEEFIKSLRVNDYDAKHKYCMTINFDKFVGGLGFCVTKTANDINYLKSRAEAYRTSCHVIIRENRAKYPSFDWVALEEYHLYY